MQFSIPAKNERGWAIFRPGTHSWDELAYAFRDMRRLGLRRPNLVYCAVGQELGRKLRPGLDLSGDTSPR